jgi:NADPH:quinone reductase
MANYDAQPQGHAANHRVTAAHDCLGHGLEQVPQAHGDMEHDRATGKLVVRVRH